MVFEPSGMGRVAAETSRADAMMLASDHTAQPSKVAFGTVDVDAIKKAVGIRVIDPLDVEAGEQVPMWRFVGDESSALRHLQLGEMNGLGFIPKNARQRATAALSKRDDAATVIRAMRSDAAINTIGARICRPDVTSDIRTVNLHGPIENQALCLEGEGFPDLVRQNKRCLVGQSRASRQLKSRDAFRAVDEYGDPPNRSTNASFRDAKIVPLVTLN
jgi:hypothetical protein